MADRSPANGPARHADPFAFRLLTAVGVAVGVGENKGVPGIVVYIKSVKAAKLDFLKQGWEGFPVFVRKMGTPRLAASFLLAGSKAVGE